MTTLPLVPGGRLGAQKSPQESSCGFHKGRKPHRWPLLPPPLEAPCVPLPFFIFLEVEDEYLFCVISIKRALVNEYYKVAGAGARRRLQPQPAYGLLVVHGDRVYLATTSQLSQCLHMILNSRLCSLFNRTLLICTHYDNSLSSHQAVWPNSLGLSRWLRVTREKMNAVLNVFLIVVHIFFFQILR